MAAGCYTIDVQVAMLRLLFFARRWGTAPIFAVLQAGDGHVSSWTTALRQDLISHGSVSCADCGKVCRGKGGLRAHGKRCENHASSFSAQFVAGA